MLEVFVFMIKYCLINPLRYDNIYLYCEDKGDILEIKDFFKNNPSVVVAFSGGVDSSVILHMAKKYALRVQAAYIKSEFQPKFEFNAAVEFCKKLDVKLDIIDVKMLEIKEISSNPINRCYLCKKTIFENILSYYGGLNGAVVIDGTNASDDISDRPGYKALQELKVLSPLKICGFTKDDIRNYAKNNGLSVCNKPSYSCLATRVPVNLRITPVLLQKTENAEQFMYKMGFNNFKVNYLDGYACIEVCADQMNSIVKKRNLITAELTKYYKGVLLNLKER